MRHTIAHAREQRPLPWSRRSKLTSLRRAWLAAAHATTQALPAAVILAGGAVATVVVARMVGTVNRGGCAVCGPLSRLSSHTVQHRAHYPAEVKPRTYRSALSQPRGRPSARWCSPTPFVRPSTSPRRRMPLCRAWRWWWRPLRRNAPARLGWTWPVLCAAPSCVPWRQHCVHICSVVAATAVAILAILAVAACVSCRSWPRLARGCARRHGWRCGAVVSMRAGRRGVGQVPLHHRPTHRHRHQCPHRRCRYSTPPVCHHVRLLVWYQ